MLRIDTIDSLNKILELICEKRHRAASTLFRCALETADLAHYFASNNDKAQKQLQKWYDKNEFPKHADIRKWIEISKSETEAQERRKFFTDLSKFSHRSYRALLKSYSLGKDNLMVYDG